MSIRDLKNKSRLALHGAMSLPAVYVTLEPTRAETPCSVRDHTKTKAMGDMAGFDYGPAERITLVPEIVALAADVSPVRGGIYVLGANEAYEVETVMPVDGVTVTTQVTKMKQSEIDSIDPPLPVPV